MDRYDLELIQEEFSRAKSNMIYPDRQFLASILNSEYQPHLYSGNDGQVVRFKIYSGDNRGIWTHVIGLLINRLGRNRIYFITAGDPGYITISKYAPIPIPLPIPLQIRRTWLIEVEDEEDVDELEDEIPW